MTRELGPAKGAACLRCCCQSRGSKCRMPYPAPAMPESSPRDTGRSSQHFLALCRQIRLEIGYRAEALPKGCRTAATYQSALLASRLESSGRRCQTRNGYRSLWKGFAASPTNQGSRRPIAQAPRCPIPAPLQLPKAGQGPDLTRSSPDELRAQSPG